MVDTFLKGIKAEANHMVIELINRNIITENLVYLTTGYKRVNKSKRIGWISPINK